ncbi:Tn3 family transposase [Streptomyces sp. SS7]|uniref:Tn3 family transposase n=1 Tax=Streptomyces sp. SS7 TaxID=3108485 RepID=UPI0030EBD722
MSTPGPRCCRSRWRQAGRVDLPEVLLEVFSWTGADQAFASITGGEARLKDLHMTVAALLVAHGCNVGHTPVIGGPASRP